MVNLKEIVSGFLLESGYGEAEFARAYQIGVRGLKDVSRMLNPFIVREKLFIKDNLTANEPFGCLKILKVGTLSKCGKELISLCKTLYSIKGNKVYFCPSFKDLGCCEIYVEYSTVMTDDKGNEIFVPDVLYETVLAYIRWKFHINKKNQDKWDKQYFHRTYLEELRKSKLILKSNTKEELESFAKTSNRVWMVNWR